MEILKSKITSFLVTRWPQTGWGEGQKLKITPFPGQARHYYRPGTQLNPYLILTTTDEIGPITIIFIFQVRKLCHKEDEGLDSGHLTGKWQAQDSRQRWPEIQGIHS